MKNVAIFGTVGSGDQGDLACSKTRLAVTCGGAEGGRGLHEPDRGPLSGVVACHDLEAEAL
jgi:hypothetical protein